jgi:hypothetical protein
MPGGLGRLQAGPERHLGECRAGVGLTVEVVVKSVGPGTRRTRLACRRRGNGTARAGQVNHVLRPAAESEGRPSPTSRDACCYASGQARAGAGWLALLAGRGRALAAAALPDQAATSWLGPGSRRGRALAARARRWHPEGFPRRARSLDLDVAFRAGGEGGKGHEQDERAAGD